MDVIKKIIKSHGMSSEKASRVKKRGHNKEHILQPVILEEIQQRKGKYCPCNHCMNSTPMPHQHNNKSQDSL